MFDGIKIICIGTTAEDWLSNDLLKFSTSVDEVTGEILKKNKVAFHRGLSFHLIPSTVSNTVHCILKGSLAVYHNQGLDNAYDFNYSMLVNTIDELKTLFSINPDLAKIQTFEFGVNLIISQSIRQVILGLRAFENDNFVLLKMENVNAGRMISRTEYAFKIYDKGKQSRADKSLLRIEYSSKRFRNGQKFKIEKLTDLLDLSKIEALKTTLCEFWDNVIFYDKGMKLELMKEKQKEKMLIYLDATSWIKFTKMQRSRAKTHFEELSTRFGTSTTQSEISRLLREKLYELTLKKESQPTHLETKKVTISPTFRGEKGYHIPNFLEVKNNKKGNSKMLPFLCLDEQGNSNIKKTINLNADRKDEVKNTLLNYQEQKEAILEHNRLAVQNYNAKYNL